MRNSLIDGFGSYKQMSFVRNSVTWRLISSEENPESDLILKTLDTFTDGKGNYKTFTRGKIDEMVEQGLITA